MELKNKLYQMFILGTVGDGYKLLLPQGLGGIIFFSHDIKSYGQFRVLVQEIEQSSSIIPFLSIDQEGGRVERTESIHKGKKYLSAKYAFENGAEFLEKQTIAIAAELKSYGLNLNFAPCIDVNTNPNNPIIGERAYSNKPEEVISAERIVSQTYRANGIVPCVKHYPGHGDADADSHLTLPVLDKTLEEMEPHISPFKSAASGEIEMIMAAHLHCTCFDKEAVPASLSKNAIGYLRKELGYEGVIVSDDMQMKGVAGFGLSEAFEKGIRAGLNMFICRDSYLDTIHAIDKIAIKALTDDGLRKDIENSYEKIMELKQKSLSKTL